MLILACAPFPATIPYYSLFLFTHIHDLSFPPSLLQVRIPFSACSCVQSMPSSWLLTNQSTNWLITAFHLISQLPNYVEHTLPLASYPKQSMQGSRTNCHQHYISTQFRPSEQEPWLRCGSLYRCMWQHHAPPERLAFKDHLDTTNP